MDSIVHAKLRAIAVVLFAVGLTVAGVWPATYARVSVLPIEDDPQGSFRSGEVVVRFWEEVPSMSLTAMLDLYGATIRHSSDGGTAQLWLVAEGEEVATIESLGADPRVRYAEPNYLYRASIMPNDPSVSKQWAHSVIKSFGAWDLAVGDSLQIIAIIDSGIDDMHPDLRAKIVGGQDIVDGDTDPHDSNGHGTHVAGIASAVTNNALGVAGMDWQARIMPVRVLGTDGTGTNWDIGQGIRWAYQHGARVLNLSLSGPGNSEFIREAVAAAQAAGSLVVAAMGNCRYYSPPECPVANPISYPAAYEGVLAVAATTITDGYASYSQHGEYCDVSAPGGELAYLGDPDGILSTLPTYDDFYLRTAYGHSRGYDYLQGTSMATSYVSGLASLVWSARPSLTPQQVAEVIKASAVDLGVPGQDDDFGHGRINAEAALAGISAPKAPTLSPIENGWFGNYSLNWSDVPNATTYTLQEDDNAGFSSPKVLYTGADSQFPVSAQDGGTWYYRVRATNSLGNSPWSNVQWVIVVPKKVALSPIDNPDNDGEYELRWSSSVGATGYKLAETTSPSGSDHVLRYVGSETHYKVTGQPEGTWYYVVWPYNVAGDGVWSNPQSTTVAPAPLPAPDLLGIDNPDSDGDYVVRWKQVTGATSYSLEQSNDPYFFQPIGVYSGTALQYAVANQAGGTWYYRVRATGPTGSSPWSVVRSTSVRSTVYLPGIVRKHETSGIAGGIENGDFEAGALGWEQYSSHQSTLIVNSGFPQGITPRSGKWAVWMGGFPDEVSYIQQRVTVPSDKPYLAFWKWIDSREVCGHFYDFGAVVVDGTIVSKYDLCWFESTASWKPHVVDLGAYRGQSIVLQIRAETDDSMNSNLFVDDVSFAASPSGTSMLERKQDRNMLGDATGKPAPEGPLQP